MVTCSSEEHVNTLATMSTSMIQQYQAIIVILHFQQNFQQLPIPFILRSYRLFLSSMMSGPTCDLPPVGVMAVASCGEATDLLEVVFDEVLEPLDAAGSALWRRRTSASDCPLRYSVGEVSRSRLRIETC